LAVAPFAEAFELTTGFAVMSHVCDPVDLLANAVGVGVALMLDLLQRRITTPRNVG
jgi:hypothetical protein